MSLKGIEIAGPDGFIETPIFENGCWQVKFVG